MKKTALYDEHLKANGKMVEFGGWMMPVQYTGIADEHEACRKSVGLFDVSHMGEISVTGQDALTFLNLLVSNNVSKITDNQAQYTVMCYENGTCVDDLLIHRISETDFFLCINAANTDKDFNWIENLAKKKRLNVRVENVSQQYSQLALQGRNAEKILQKYTNIPLSSMKYYWFQKGLVLDKPALIARTGYTGEDGFEIYVSWNDGPALWRALLEEGNLFGIKPCGLGARDTLRTEMKFPLYGNEIDDQTLPLEAGLSWVVKLDKPEFMGKQALIAAKESGIKKTLVGLRSLTKAIPRAGYKVALPKHEGSEGQVIGKVTSGTLSPNLKIGIAIASVPKSIAAIGTKVDIIIRDQRHPHEVVSTPFYKRDY